jgi:hypothetical protein
MPLINGGMLHKIAPRLNYNSIKNLISGFLDFNLTFTETGVLISDAYQIEIDLDRMKNQLPVVKETGGRIIELAKKKGKNLSDLHIGPTGEMCIIIPPKIKEKYPNGFNLKKYIYHIQEHLYYISYYERYDKEAWPSYSHGDEGYLELYLSDPNKYGKDFMDYFKCNSRPEIRRKLKELRKLHNR